MDPNPNEVSEVAYVKREGINETLKNLNAPLTPWFKLILDHELLSFFWDRLHEIDKYQDRFTIHKLE